MRSLKQNQSILTQTVPHNFAGTSVSIHFWDWKSLIYRIWITAAAYKSLLKLPSATLNSFSALVGVLLAAGGTIPWVTASIVTASVWLVAAGCGALNSYIDRDIDQLMQRTSRRPIPAGTIAPAVKALYIGMFFVILGLIIAIFWLNLLATSLIASGAAIYILVYTLWLKRKTPWSVVIGGLAGSCALLAGWFSITDSFGLFPLLFGAFIFLWTPGHFWGLAIRTKNDGEHANIPTLPIVFGDRIATKWTALSNLVLIPLSIIPYALGLLGEVYLLIVLLTGFIVLTANISLLLAPTAPKAWLVFKLSSPYLAIIYLAAAADIYLI